MQQKAPEQGRKPVVMSFNALTTAFAKGIEERYGPARFFNAADLRKSRSLDAIRTLIQISSHKIVIAIETEIGRPLAVPLSIAAAFTRGRSIDVVWPDFKTEPVSRLKVLRTCVNAVWQTIVARRSLRRWLRIAKNPPNSARISENKGDHRVLYLDANISLGAPSGGWVGHTAGVIDGLVDRGYAITYASAKACPSSAAKEFRLQPPGMLSFPSELNYYPYGDRIVEIVGQLLESEPATFIYQRLSMHNSSGAMLKRQMGVPYVVEYNGSEVWVAQNWSTGLSFPECAAVMQTMALKEADLVVTVSEGLAADCLAQGISPDRLLVYPNGVRTDVFDPDRFPRDDTDALRDNLGIERSARLVGFLGTFGQWHGVDFLAECIVRLIRDDAAWLDSHRIHFLLIGHGLMMPKVMEILDGQLNFRKYVTLAGLVPSASAPRYLAACDILVSPHVPNPDKSEFFGSPTKLFEYMAMKRPILAADLAQIGLVLSGKGAGDIQSLPDGTGRACGLLYRPADVEGFISGLKQLATNPDLAAQLADSARREVLMRYTWDHHVQAILDRMSKLGLIDSDRAKV